MLPYMWGNPVEYTTPPAEPPWRCPVDRCIVKSEHDHEPEGGDRRLRELRQSLADYEQRHPHLAEKTK